MSSWRKSKHDPDDRDDPDEGVEVKHTEEDVWVRDPSDPNGREVKFSRDAWKLFLRSISDGPDPA
ncbi:DUF397 domain-containing protein [Lentzea sp. BCCO 10_0856]|uniref:DUF397 domain-containing protein n=1 Tax=Lentzea miocenica TaxID=3095431 RepID=A0ABU4SVA0_9PSEU|nr:DUF397 domain-containing protein [Lentzea sp. BCCO 10_0856]MDX8029838.1 DUF397 domain-containing protein [Lentzea sp. BCCO 10_0856]